MVANFELWVKQQDGWVDAVGSIEESNDNVTITVRDQNGNQIMEQRESWKLIKVLACGLCATDIASVEGLLPFPFPLVAGHEIIGTQEGSNQ